MAMLHEFLTLHRDDIIARTRAKVAARTAPRATQTELEHGVSIFLDQLAATLRCEQGTPARVTGEEIARGAAMHGGELRVRASRSRRSPTIAATSARR